MPDTTRWNHPYPEYTDEPDVPADLQALAESLDDVAKDDQGVAFPGGSPSAGQYFYRLDEEVLYRHDGVNWRAVNPQDESAATPSLRTLGTGSTQAAAGNDSRFTDLQSDVSDLQTDVGTLQSDVTTLQNDVLELEQMIWFGI